MVDRMTIFLGITVGCALGAAVALLAVTEMRKRAEPTRKLREALSSSKARGQGGERMAEDVLRLAGLLEGVNYRKQTTIDGAGRPDYTFLLPNGRVMHMDVKFPLDNYVRHLEAGSD